MFRALPFSSSLLLCGFMLAATPSGARANGNVSHQWVTRAAIDQTPTGGSLETIVTDPALGPILDVGTMFPDWGYTPGATMQERDAGEASHWEPVQEGYRQWIVANYSPPWSAEARAHLAFYLGMTSHGMADQSYDAMFFERSEFYEPGDHSEFDQDTDVMWAATAGPGEVPRVWIPSAPLLELFQSVGGVTIDEVSMEQQVGLVGVGIAGVNILARDPVAVADAEADFPWAAAHDDDRVTPGNPPHEAEIVRRYWRSNWSLLHGDAVPRPVLWTFPADGSAAHSVESASIESWSSVVFARALDAAALDVGQFHVEGEGGGEVPIDIDLFYGDGSHVVHIKPLADLEADTIYVVTVDPGVSTIHGESLEGWSFTFSTGARPVPPLHDDGFWDEPDPYGDEPGGDSSGGSSGGLDSGSTSAADGGTTGGGSGGGTTSGATTSSGAADDPVDAGCGCSAPRHRWGGLGLVGLVVLAGRRRR